MLTTFGSGAMMDLPTRAVVVSSLDHWDGNRGAFKRIEEPRLQTLLQTQLVASGRWVPNRPLNLRTPRSHRRRGRIPIPPVSRSAFSPPGLRVKECRMRAAAVRGGAGWCRGKIWRRTADGKSIGERMTSASMSRRSGSSALAGRATFRTSTGDGFCTKAKRAANRCGSRRRARAPIRRISASGACAAPKIHT